MPPLKRVANAYSSKARQVENRLCPPVVMPGQTPAHWELEQRMAHYRVPGVSIALIDGFQIEWANSYGVLEAGSCHPVRKETAFQAASVSKPTTALAVLKLVDDGQLDLDQEVNARLQCWQVPKNRYTRDAKVTVRRLLSHTAGLTVHAFSGYHLDEELPTLVRAVPGSEFRYSGGGYGVLEQLLFDVTGQPFPELMHQMVFEPLGLAHSTFEQPSLSNGFPSVACGHRADGTVIRDGWEVDPVLAPAGLWSTPSDLASLALELARAYNGGPGRLLSQGLARAMLTPQVETGWESRRRWMGLGLLLSDGGEAGYFSHSGSNAGYRCLLVASRQGGRGAVVMTNGDAGDLLIEEIIQGIAQVYHWPGMEPEVRPMARVDPGILQSYVGEYQLTPCNVVSIVLEEGGLVMQAPRSIPLPLFPQAETQFFSTATVMPIRFVRDDCQRVTHMELGREIANRIR
jgi:CubicO group peptidase (beta-lactamase class C family)